MAVVFSFLYLALFIFSGLGVSRVLFYKDRPLVRVWLGLAFGMLMLIWLPALFSFIFGFVMLSQLLGAAAAALIGGVCWLVSSKKSLSVSPLKKELPFLIAGGALFLLSLVLLSSHTIVERDGALYVGQSTYGDLAMHLGFISSIAVQGTFPPMYSICADKAVCYPFLSESVGSTFYLFGTSLRFAVIFTSAFAFLLVILGVYCFFEEWLRQKRKAVFAMLLFFVGGGFGFWYFFDLLKANPDNLTRLFTAFYETPTNFVSNGLRWVNPIADMMIPQRALLFGWSLLFPCLFLLYRAAIKRQTEAFVPLAVLAGGLPLIHTHSFLALGLVSAFYLLRSFARREGKKQYYGYLRYLVIVLALALPQLIAFTFRQTGGFLKFHFNWANESDNYFWFYIKNFGLIALLFPVAFIAANKEERGVVGGGLLVWAVAEFIQFQPNTYDNNKLLFITFAFACGLVGSWLIDTKDRLMKGPVRNRVSIAVLSAVVCLVLFLSGVLTLGREYVSEYQLIGSDEVLAAEYVEENAAPDATFLTYNNHNNCIAALTGRNIVCGSGSYLYFHGVDYSEHEAALPLMYEQPSLYFDSLSEKFGVDYVLIGNYERANYDIDYEYFSENFTVFYQNDSVIIYSVD
ncbi:MAG TPA: hypothetical protein P5075_09795 [Eubacteriales bacterium]|nr:hypothetical protein [Eubacteriales bacterium]